MKKHHATRHRHMAVLRRADDKRRRLRLEVEALATVKDHPDWDRFRWCGNWVLRPPAFGPVTFTLPALSAVDDGSAAWAARKRWA